MASNTTQKWSNTYNNKKQFCFSVLKASIWIPLEKLKPVLTINLITCMYKRLCKRLASVSKNYLREKVFES